MDFNGTTDFAEAFVKLKYESSGPGKGSLQLEGLVHSFPGFQAPNVNGDDYRDQDLGSSAPVLPTNTNLMIGAGKDGILYVLDREPRQEDRRPQRLETPPLFHHLQRLGLPTAHQGSTFPWGRPVRTGLSQEDASSARVAGVLGGPGGPMIFDWGENESLRSWKLDPGSGKVVSSVRARKLHRARRHSTTAAVE